MLSSLFKNDFVDEKFDSPRIEGVVKKKCSGEGIEAMLIEPDIVPPKKNS